MPLLVTPWPHGGAADGVVQDRSSAGRARFRVRWQAGRASPVRSYTFVSAPVSRGPSEAQKAARRLAAYLDLIGHHLNVVEALLGAGYRVEGYPAPALTPVAGPAPEVESGPEVESEPIVTVAAYAERWLATLVRPNPRTREDYRKLLERHVLPVLGHLDIAALGRAQVALWLRAQEASISGRGSREAPRPRRCTRSRIATECSPPC